MFFGEDIKFFFKQYMQCFIVKLVMSLLFSYKDKLVLEQILNYYRVNEVQQFRYFWLFWKGEKDLDNEFVMMWIEWIMYMIVYIFFGIFKWFEVKQILIEEISFLENVIEIMELINERISNCVQQYVWDWFFFVYFFFMLFSGIVDLVVMGGFFNYEKVFFIEKYLQEYFEDQEKVELLK